MSRSVGGRNGSGVMRNNKGHSMFSRGVFVAPVASSPASPIPEQCAHAGGNRPGAAHDTNSIEITASTWRSTSDGSTGSTPARSRHSGASTKMVAAAPVNR